MRDILRWVIVGGSALWLLAGFGAWREGLEGWELLDEVPLMVWVPRLVGLAWIWLIVGSLTVWKGRWAWPETLAFTLMLLYPTGLTALIFIVPVVVWGVFRWQQRRAVPA